MSTQHKTVRDVLTEHLLNGTLYPRLLELPEASPALRFTVVEPYQPLDVEGYSVLPVPVSHAVPTVGYQLSSPSGGVVFYTADTGSGLGRCWGARVASAPHHRSHGAGWATRGSPGVAGASDPGAPLGAGSWAAFREMKGYLPPVVVVHMNPRFEKTDRG